MSLFGPRIWRNHVKVSRVTRHATKRPHKLRAKRAEKHGIRRTALRAPQLRLHESFTRAGRCGILSRRPLEAPSLILSTEAAGARIDGSIVDERVDDLSLVVRGRCAKLRGGRFFGHRRLAAKALRLW